MLLQYLLVHISVHVFIDTHKGTDARYTETSPYSSRSTTVLDNGHLVFWVESGTHQTSNPPFLTISKHIKLGFVAPKNFRPLRAWPVLMRLRQFFRSVNYFLGMNGLQTPTLPFRSSLPKRHFIVVTEILSSRIGEISVRIWGAVRRELEREVLMIILSMSLLILWGPPVLGRFCRDRRCCVSSNQWESDCLETCKIATTSANPCPALSCLTVLSFNSTV